MAAITYSDHMLGKALQKLKDLGQENNTIVVFHSDHGMDKTHGDLRRLDGFADETG